MPTKRRFAGKGFTLIELLVVIGIIGILVALLMPALAAVRFKAKKTRAQSEARQLAVAWTAYVDDHGAASDGVMDPAHVALLGSYMEINTNSLDASGAFVDPWRQAYHVTFGSAGNVAVQKSYWTRAFLHNYNRDALGNE